METIEAIKSRRSIRKFKEDNIPHEILEKIVHTATYAPSWKNTQITRYIVVDNNEIKEKIALSHVPEFNQKNNIECACANGIICSEKPIWI